MDTVPPQERLSWLLNRFNLPVGNERISFPFEIVPIINWNKEGLKKEP
jgi:hypothetical protein